jgi:hypothetical protein
MIHEIPPWPVPLEPALEAACGWKAESRAETAEGEPVPGFRFAPSAEPAASSPPPDFRVRMAAAGPAARRVIPENPRSAETGLALLFLLLLIMFS